MGQLTNDQLIKAIDRAAELKMMEKDLATERNNLEEMIAAHVAALPSNGKNSISLDGTIASVSVQQKTKDTWLPDICKEIAGMVPIDVFGKLFKVTFSGQKREIVKFMADTESSDVRALLKKACLSEPARPYIKYEISVEEAVA